MSDYIKREDAMDAWYWNERYTDIEGIPSADVVERKHGKWKKAYLDHESFGVRPKIVPKWIPTSERLPEESRHYLIYVIGGEFKEWSMVTMAYYHKRFYYDNMEDNFAQVTHWMPLPEPPKDGEK